VVILILVFVVLVSKLGSGSKPSNSPDSPKISQSDYIKEKINTPINLDTYVKNALTCGSLAVTDDYIFYSNSEGLYRINKDGSNKLELEQGEISNINIYNNYLYYTKRISENKTISSTNYTHNIIKQSFDGSEKTEIASMNCQRIDSMLAVNDLLIYKLVIFEGDGGKTIMVKKPEARQQIPGRILENPEDIGDVSEQQFSSIMTLNYPFNQTELNQYLREAGYDNFSVKSAYSVSDTMYFETRRMKNPRDTVIFSISKKDNKLNLIARYDTVEENDYTIEYTLTGFSYNESDNSLYYILSTRKRDKNNVITGEKLEMCKLDLSSNSITVIDTILSKGF